MLKPSFPVITIQDDYVNILPDDACMTRTTLLGVISSRAVLAFDREGEHWHYTLVSPAVQDNFLTRLLANTVYNPMVDTQIQWVRVGNYALEELKTHLYTCLREDDDILTQFVSAETFRQAIAESATFDDLYQVLNRFVFEVDEGLLTEEDG
jgi:hypothetical protein